MQFWKVYFQLFILFIICLWWVYLTDHIKMQQESIPVAIHPQCKDWNLIHPHTSAINPRSLQKVKLSKKSHFISFILKKYIYLEWISFWKALQENFQQSLWQVSKLDSTIRVKSCLPRVRHQPCLQRFPSVIRRPCLPDAFTAKNFLSAG